MKKIGIEKAVLIAVSCLFSCSYVNARNSAYDISRIEFDLTECSGQKRVQTINVDVTYSLQIKFYDSKSHYCPVSSEDLCLQYDSDILSLSSLNGQNSTPVFYFFLKGSAIWNNASIKASVGSFEASCRFEIVDEHVDSTLQYKSSQAIYGMDEIEVIKDRLSAESVVSKYKGLAQKLNNSVFTDEFYNFSYLLLFNYNYNNSDLYNKYKFAFVNDSTLYLCFDVGVGSDPEFELKQNFYAISVGKNVDFEEVLIYKSFIDQRNPYK
ncbi:MAG: hypothetical protein MJ239_03030 [Bacilli bacterium]|nr:hypothetical protein [Bacilli bacterium]